MVGGFSSGRLPFITPNTAKAWCMAWLLVGGRDVVRYDITASSMVSGVLLPDGRLLV